MPGQYVTAMPAIHGDSELDVVVAGAAAGEHDQVRHRVQDPCVIAPAPDEAGAGGTRASAELCLRVPAQLHEFEAAGPHERTIRSVERETLGVRGDDHRAHPRPFGMTANGSGPIVGITMVAPGRRVAYARAKTAGSTVAPAP